MPKIGTPMEAGAGTPTLDLNPDLSDLTKTLRNHLTAQTTAKIYKDLAAPSDTSLPVLQGLGDALGGLAQGWKGVSDMQGTLQQQILQHLQQPGTSSGGPREILEWVMMLQVIRQMSPENTAKKDEDAPSWRDLLAEQEKRHQEVREAEHSVGPSPIDQQFQQVMFQLLAQNLQATLAPRDPLDPIRQAKAQVQELQGLAGDPQTSREDKLLDLQRDRLHLEHAERVKKIDDDKEARQKDWPNLVNHAVGSVSQLLGQLGFRPHEAGGQRLVSPDAIAAAQAAATGASA